MVPPEPLERELAVQVEYDMDEQGTFIQGCAVRSASALTF
jgi:hypothetical protein